jgi:hypothetical protein
MKHFLIITGGVVLLAASAVVSLWWSGKAVSQFRGQYEPLYAGIDSPGAIPAPQDQNPRHFFEERVDWPLLNIAEPRTAWEYTQRGIHFQDDVGDVEAAMADYMRADALERGRSCGPGIAPVPGRACLQILRARLANIYLERGEYARAIDELDFILEENPLAPGLHFELAEAYLGLGNQDKAIEEFEHELETQPCHQATHFELGELLLERGNEIEGRQHLTEYLQQALLHCDSFPYKILKARKLLTDHGGPLEMTGSACPATLKGPVSQVLSISASQISARLGCNPAGTRFHEEG